MVRYRRNRLAGGTYFFTVALFDRRACLLVEHIGLLRDAFQETLRRRPFATRAIVVLPDHLHAIWTLPEGDSDYPGRWRSIKALFTRSLKADGIGLVQDTRGEHRVWQRRYWEHTIRDDADLERHVDYIHYNPVRHGLVTHPARWEWSSFHRYVREGLLPADWSGSAPESESGFGE